MPQFSVVIPTFNRAHLVGRAIRSVLAQTIDDFEVLVAGERMTTASPAPGARP